MIDIETMGKGSKAAIVSVAMVFFSLNSSRATGTTYSANIKLQSCLDAGLKVDGDTIEWWLKQSDEARNGLLEYRKPLVDVLEEIKVVINHENPNVKVWGNGASFDLAILKDAYDAVNLPLPWKYYNERDVRTLVDFAPQIKKDMPFDGVKHDAFADCLHQIKYCRAIHQKIWVYENEKP